MEVKSHQQLLMERAKIEHDKTVKIIIENKFTPIFEDIDGGLKNVVTFIAMAAQFVEMSAKNKLADMKIEELSIKAPFIKGDKEGDRFNALFESCKDYKVDEFTSAINTFTSKLQKHLLRTGLDKKLKDYDLEKVLEEKTS